MSNPRRPANADIVRRFVPAASLNRETFSELVKHGIISSHGPGEVLLRPGVDLTDRLYLVAGEVEVVDEQAGKQFTVNATQEQSKHPLVSERTSTSLIRTVGQAEILHLNAEKLDVLVTWDQLSGIHVEEISEETSAFAASVTSVGDDSDWIARMLSSRSFQRVPPTNIQKLFMQFEELSVNAGEVIIQQGDEGDFYYVVRTGSFAVTRESSSGRSVELARLGPGSSFGEEALLAHAQRNATVTATEPGALMRLSGDGFRELLQEPLVHRVDIDTARGMVREGAKLIDVRMESEHKVGSIKGSLNVPLFMLRLKLSSLDRGSAYVCYCDTGRRSQAAAYLLSEAGFEAWLLDGGLEAVSAAKGAQTAEPLG